jgi:hypothetical protein
MSDFPTDKNSCLCCGQLVYKGGKQRTIIELEVEAEFLGAMGYEREELLTKHREQVEYQLPGMIEWLTAQ